MSKTSLIERMLKTTSLGSVALINDSPFFNQKQQYPTNIPALNIALSGSITGGFSSGLTVFAAESKHFKSLFALTMARSFQRKHKDGIILMYDSEFGSPPSYLESVGVDVKRVIHIPIMNIEELKFDLKSKLDEINVEDNIMILVDSIGNLASLKEVDNATDEKSVLDMTRAKELKSTFRIVTPLLTKKQVPMVCVNHVYDTQENYSKQVMGGGQGIMLSADNVFFISKRQEKDGTDLTGYTFTIIAEKSRFIKEKAKIPITVKFDLGIDVFSGMLDLAVEYGSIVKPSNGWYQTMNKETGELNTKLRRKAIETKEHMIPILKDEGFKKFIEMKYKISGEDKKLIVDDGVDTQEIL